MASFHRERKKMTSKLEYEGILVDLEWLKLNHPERTSLIAFAEKFVEHVKSVYEKHDEDYDATFSRRNLSSSVQ
jgi:hypothetical protein